MTSPLSVHAALSCADDYDPDSLPLERARALMLSLLAPVSATQRLFVREALGRVLAADVVAPLAVPDHDNSAMDGYALRHADLGAGETALRLTGSAFAGRPFAGTVAAGECVRIMTGAVLPDGADTVVMQEVVRVDGERIVIPAGQRAGQNVRLAGEDLRPGQVAVAAGRRLGAAELGVIASLGVAELTVRRRPRVALFSTGDELRPLGSALGPGQIYDSNRYTLWALLTALGCDVLDMGAVADDPAALEQALREAADTADAIVTSGGVSVGDADFVKSLMNRMGEVAFWKIAIKPGRPMAFGRIAGAAGGAWLFGLPGNPVAVMVTFLQLVRPALLTLAGMAPLPPVPAFAARCLEPLKKARGRTEFQRGVLVADGAGWSVRPTGAQGSAILTSMSQADCFIVLEADRAAVAAGETVTVQPFFALL